jgi:hypothetical protein
MTNAEKILNFLQKEQQPFCDDCLSELCGVHPRQQVNQICNLRISDRLITAENQCRRCQKVKLTRKSR